MSNGTPGHDAAALRKERIKFDAMNLQVGGKLQLLVTRDIKQVQLFSNLIGYVKDEYLLVQIPMDSLTLFPIREGEKVTMRVFSGVHVCWFDTAVVKIFSPPYSFMHVSFPQEIYGTPLRTAVRVKVDIPAKAQLSMANGAGSEFGISLQDLSVAGARVKATSEIPESVELIELIFPISIQVGAFTIEVRAQAKVRNRSGQIEPDPINPYIYSYGVEFVRLEATHQLAVQNFIYERLAEDWRSLV